MADNHHDINESVIDYLSSLVWDSTPRLDRWLINCAGAADTPQVREASRKTLIAAVRRTRHPGCRLDQVLILEGPQGCGKSSLLRVLAIREAWFTDEFPLNPRGLVEATEGKWIVELTSLHPSNSAGLKACLSRQHDMYRKLYDRKRLQTERDQLWAEAAAAEALDESIRLDAPKNTLFKRPGSATSQILIDARR